MPIYDYKCGTCERVSEELFNMTERPDDIRCTDPKCNGIAVRIISSGLRRNAESKPMWSKAFGINPDQINEMRQRFPDDEYHPKTGAMRINGFEHQKKIAKRLGMVID